MCIHLLSNYAKLLDMETNRRWNASHFAAWGGNVEIMKYLKEKGLNLTMKTSNNYTILHIAAKYNQYGMCKYILENHLELLELKTEDGLNAAHYAAKRSNSEIFKLLKNDRNVLEKTNTQKTILHIACEVGNTDHGTAFFNHIAGICTPILKDVDDEGWNALHFAAKSGNVEIARELNQSGLQTKKTSDGKTVLHIACTYKMYDMCCFITKQFPLLIHECNSRGWNAAHYVVVDPKENDDSIHILEHLLSYNVNLEKLTNSGNTVLTMACYHKNTKIIKHLLHKYPSLLHIRSKKSLLDVAAESNNEEIRTLIDEAVKIRPVSYQS